jgi:hypothetical protein
MNNEKWREAPSALLAKFPFSIFPLSFVISDPVGSNL